MQCFNCAIKEILHECQYRIMLAVLFSLFSQLIYVNHSKFLHYNTKQYRIWLPFCMETFSTSCNHQKEVLYSYEDVTCFKYTRVDKMINYYVYCAGIDSQSYFIVPMYAQSELNRLWSK